MKKRCRHPYHAVFFDETGIGFFIYCSLCLGHTPIVRNLTVARLLWEKKVIIDNYLYKDYLKLKKVVDFLCKNIQHISCLWQYLAPKVRKKSPSTARELSKRLNKVSSFYGKYKRCDVTTVVEEPVVNTTNIVNIIEEDVVHQTVLVDVEKVDSGNLSIF